MPMILEVEDYCEDCFRFRPMATRVVMEDLNFNRTPETRIFCKYHNECRRMCEHIRRKMEDDGK